MNAAPGLNDALALSRAGWAVIPLNGKVPRTAHGVKDATTEPAIIESWWRNGTRHNVGARVPESFVVIDIDPQNGGSRDGIEAAIGEALRETLVVHSGRGTGGHHRYYLHPGGALTSSRLPAGVDVKTSTGYCVMPPSLHPATGMPYRWDGERVAHMQRALHRLIAVERTTSPRPRQPGSGRLDSLVAHVARLGEGGRNAGLYWAACRAAEEGADDASLALLIDAAVSAGLSVAEASRTVASAKRTTGVAS